MASLNYNLDTLYRLAFPDLASKALTKLDSTRDLALGQLDQALGNSYQVPTDYTPTPKLDFSGINVKRIIQGEAMSYLGLPIFQPITFLGGTYQQLGTGAQAGQVIDDAYVSWVLPATATAEFSQTKAIEKSKPSTGTSSVKELWGFDDWNITIRGLILDPEPNVFPEGQLRHLVRWGRVADSIEVAGDMFAYLGIRRLVIESLNIGKVAGSPNVIPFQMSCLSDEPIELTILSNALTQTPTRSTSATLPPGYAHVIADGSAAPKR